jgi:hypothetical protein
MFSFIKINKVVSEKELNDKKRKKRKRKYKKYFKNREVSLN